MDDDVERAALRFHRGHQFFGRSKTSKVVRNGQDIRVVFGDRGARFIRRRSTGPIRECHVVTVGRKGSRNSRAESRRRAGN